MIDPEARERLAKWGGPELIQEMYQLFLQNADERIAQMRVGVERKEWVEVERGAHSLKSSASNVGATEVERLTVRMEELAREGRTVMLPTLLTELERAFAKTRDAIAEMMD